METNQAAKEIRQAVDMINSIAEKTNLLSLNASIEAARAGKPAGDFRWWPGKYVLLRNRAGKAPKP